MPDILAENQVPPQGRLQIHVVVGHPSSDIGKGWMAAALAVKLGLDTPVIKIDPMLSPSFPAEIGFDLGGVVVTDDAATYLGRGLTFNPSMNIVMGQWLCQTLQEPAHEQGRLDLNPLKNTHVDLGYKMAANIDTLAAGHNTVIEVGGCPDDDETIIIAHAVRILLGRYRYEVYLHVVTAYDVAANAGGPTFKIRTPVRALRTSLQTYYGVSLQNVRLYIRRANLSDIFTDQQLKEATVAVAFKLGLRPEQVKYVPNLTRPEELDAYVIYEED